MEFLRPDETGDSMDVFIAGISHTQLGRHVGQSVKDLTQAAVAGALLDAGILVGFGTRLASG